jgi:chemotaxis protein MotB
MRRRAKSEAINASERTAEGWMTTFTDLVMLMVTFFVMLLSISSLSEKSLKKAFAYHGNQPGAVESTRALAEAFGKAGLPVDKTGGSMAIKKDERGLILSIEDDVFFEPGKTEIKTGSYEILDSIAGVIASSSNDILIMGHTDDTALSGGTYESNMELSTYRSLSALDYFIEKRNLSRSRFYSGGYGPYSPLFPNDTPEHRASNRRVEIIFRHNEG